MFESLRVKTRDGMAPDCDMSCGTCREEERLILGLSGNTEGKKAFGVSGRKSEGNFKTERSEIERNGLD